MPLPSPLPSTPPVELRRYTVDLDGGAVRWEPLTDGSLELPRIDYSRRNTREYDPDELRGRLHRRLEEIEGWRVVERRARRMRTDAKKRRTGCALV